MPRFPLTGPQLRALIGGTAVAVVCFAVIAGAIVYILTGGW
jgi:hypothetical protein